jgi:hypothetical protein
MSAAPGRPKQATACRETRQAFVPSMPAHAGMEPRDSPLGGRARYSVPRGLS